MSVQYTRTSIDYNIVLYTTVMLICIIKKYNNRDCYGHLALFWPYGKTEISFSLSVSTQFDLYQRQSGEHVES